MGFSVLHDRRPSIQAAANKAETELSIDGLQSMRNLDCKREASRNDLTVNQFNLCAQMKLFVGECPCARATVTIIFICLAVCGLTEPSRAELHFQSRIESACRPAAPITQTLLRWRSACANNDCFAWRLTCSNGKTYVMQSKIHPATTELQNIFYEWAPWSFVLYLLPFLSYAALAVVGSEAPVLVAALNAVFVGYALCAAWSLYSSITGNPWGPGIEEEQLFLLNPYVYAPSSSLSC